MYNIKDLTGKIFNRLTVIERVENKKERAMWLCQCTCKKLTIVSGRDLKGEHTKSCGCLQRESYVYGIRHGLRSSRIYNNWRAMMARCYLKKHIAYKDYGGRGISVYKDWHDITSFNQWAMANGYEEGLTIERKDNNGNYEPDNCCWITMGEQALNRRNTHNITFNGITKPMSVWARECDIKTETICKRIKLGWAEVDLLKHVDVSKAHNKGKQLRKRG